MQFTVLIEFLIPGLLTTIVVLLLLFDGRLPELPKEIPGGETASVLLLLAVSYPVGILVNFPIFGTFQRFWLTPRARRKTLRALEGKGIDLLRVAERRFGIPFDKDPNRAELSRLWSLIRAAAFSLNVERLASNHLYHEGLQRFARGMFVPLLLGVLLVLRHAGDIAGWLLAALLFFLVSTYRLLDHSLETEEGQVVWFFLAAPGMAESIEAGREVTESQTPAAPAPPSAPQ